MKGVKCSWVDLLGKRQLLAAANGERVAEARCVLPSTISSWRSSLDIVDALDGKVVLKQLSHFQPTHALEIARYVRCREKNAQNWTEEIKEEIAEWVDRCETEEWTVKDLRQALLEKQTLPATEPGCTVDRPKVFFGAAMTERLCAREGCGKPITPGRQPSRQLYCSDECRKLVYLRKCRLRSLETARGKRKPGAAFAFGKLPLRQWFRCDG